MRERWSEGQKEWGRERESAGENEWLLEGVINRRSGGEKEMGREVVRETEWGNE